MAMSKTKRKYKLVGAIQFIENITAAKMGFERSMENHPVLVYSESGKFDEGMLFTKDEEFAVEDKFRFLADHLIGKKYSIDEAQAEFPELFL